MKNLPEKKHGNNRAQEREKELAFLLVDGAEVTAEERLCDYLDHLCAPLVGVVPFRERQCYREETRAHLQALIAEYQELSMTPEMALTTALREFGNPLEVGTAFVAAWRRNSALPDTTRPAFVHAFAWFGMFSVLELLLIERYLLIPYQQKLLPVLGVLLFLAPLVAGWFIGLKRPARMGQGLSGALATLAAMSLLIAQTWLPHSIALVFALCLVGLWMPVGYGAACMGVTWSLRRRFQPVQQIAN